LNQYCAPGRSKSFCNSIGTFLTFEDVRYSVAIGGKADVGQGS